MKRIAILAVMLAALMTANATSVLYFTRSQAERAVNYLNRQSELMIYCGYDYEIETYVLLNEVWAERVNSAFYELWIYGYDAYTGDEIYMPIDLQCIWLYSAGRMYNAAQYLRFRTDGSLRRPMMTWTVPAYNPYARIVHRPGYTRTYHYEVHRYGWMPPAPPSHGHHGPATHPYHPYYLRAPHTPAPRPASTWTPGVDHPMIEHPVPAGSSSGARPTPTGSNSANGQHHSAGTPATQQSGTATSAPTRSGSGTSAAPTRSTSSQNNNSGKTTAPTRSSNSSAAPTRSSSAPSTAPTRSSSTQKSENKSAAPTRSSNSSAAPTRSGATASPAPTRSSSSQKNDSKTSTPTRNSNSAAPTRSTSTQGNDDKKAAPTRGAAPIRR